MFVSVKPGREEVGNGTLGPARLFRGELDPQEFKKATRENAMQSARAPVGLGTFFMVLLYMTYVIYVIYVTYYVTCDFRKIYCSLQVKEWGNLRFDVLENVEIPTEFLLIEVYRPDAARAFFICPQS